MRQYSGGNLAVTLYLQPVIPPYIDGTKDPAINTVAATRGPAAHNRDLARRFVSAVARTSVCRVRP